MKIKRINLNNFANFDSINVSFADNITYLIGKNGSGKSTIGITSIWFMFQGIAENASKLVKSPLIGERFRFIGNGSATSKNEMVLIDENRGGAEIKVIRKLTKTGSDLSFVAPDNYPAKLDQEWLNNLFNQFLIAPKKFCELTPKDQAKALGIDTKVFDDAMTALKSEYTTINAVYRNFGDIAQVEKVERVDLLNLQSQKEQERKRLNDLFLENKKANETARKTWGDNCRAIDTECAKHNEDQNLLLAVLHKCWDALEVLRQCGYTGKESQEFIEKIATGKQAQKIAADFYTPEPTMIHETPDDAKLRAIDDEILTASATNNNAQLYELYLKKVEDKDAKYNELQANLEKQKAKEGERLAYVKSLKLPFKNLSVGEDGELLLDGKPIKEPYFSTGELLKIIPILISSQNPELKYVFLQDFNLLDDDKQVEISKYLTEKGYQLVIELVGKEKKADKHCILLRDNVIVETYEEVAQEAITL
jgi:hypothetical protein